MRTFEQWQDWIELQRTEYDHAKKTLYAVRASVADADDTYTHHDTGQQLLQIIAETVQEQAHKQIAGVVSSCLSTVFDEPYEFVIEFTRTRGKTEANLSFMRNGLQVDPIHASGGGVVDVAAFALRVACLMLHKPPLRKVMILDEPFRFVSVEYQDNVKQMLEKLANEMRIQFIMVTHIDALCCGKVISI